METVRLGASAGGSIGGRCLPVPQIPCASVQQFLGRRWRASPGKAPARIQLQAIEPRLLTTSLGISVPLLPCVLALQEAPLDWKSCVALVT